MNKVSRDFQIFVKPIGSICNLDCQYCYYIKKELLYPGTKSFQMTEDILEEYIVQHIEACPDPIIRFSWHGGEPTILGLDYFRKVVEMQQKYQSSNQKIVNGIQTNGTLLNEDWCHFFSEENFFVGLSLDGSKEMHNHYRHNRAGKPSFEQTIRGFEQLKKNEVNCEILCVVNSLNVQYPKQIYRFFKEIGAQYMTFLPLVEPHSKTKGGVSNRTVPSEAWGDFLSTIFDEWISYDIGQIKVQIFEEAIRTAFNQEHSLCIFRKTCGDIPVLEHNGDFYSCDHFVDTKHKLGNIMETPLVELLESSTQRTFGQDKWDTLPQYCQICEVKEMCNGECPKNRFIQTPEGEPGLNYLCSGYKRFFNHCYPFVSEVANQWNQQNQINKTPLIQASDSQNQPKPGRNAPCPCGSGLKYKKCCFGK
jgi:uncharacterized protein